MSLFSSAGGVFSSSLGVVVQAHLAEFNSCSTHRSGFALILKKVQKPGGLRNELEENVGTGASWKTAAELGANVLLPSVRRD